MKEQGNNIILGVIPARGGSKGLRLKNIRLLLGRPLIAYTIEVAKKTILLDDFLVSTDSREIASVAEAEGAWVPFLRPKSLATDQAPTWQTLKHAISFYEEETHRHVHSVVTLQPTSPLRKAEDIDAAITFYKQKQAEADCLISACKADNAHPLALYLKEGSWAKPFLTGVDYNQRRQDRQRVLCRNGALFISKRKLIMEQNRVVDEHPLCYEMAAFRSVNIDSTYDFKMAELHMKYEDWLMDEVG